MKVLLDDERTMPGDWTQVYWPSESIELLKPGQVTEISLDQDLGDVERGDSSNGMALARESTSIMGRANSRSLGHAFANLCVGVDTRMGIITLECPASVLGNLQIS